jgi:hypothetical protein
VEIPSNTAPKVLSFLSGLLFITWGLKPENYIPCSFPSSYFLVMIFQTEALPEVRKLEKRKGTFLMWRWQGQGGGWLSSVLMLFCLF